MIRKLDYPLGKSVEIEDLPRLREICLIHGYDCDDKDLVDVWSEYSDNRAANWLILPEDDDKLWEAIEYEVEKRFIGEDYIKVVRRKTMAGRIDTIAALDECNWNIDDACKLLESKGSKRIGGN